MVGTAFTGTLAAIAAGVGAAPATAFTGTWAALAAGVGPAPANMVGTAFTGTWATLAVGAGATAATLARAALAARTWASPPRGCAAAALATASSQCRLRGTKDRTLESW